MNKKTTKILYISLIAFLVCESAVVFLGWSVMAGVFWYVSAIVLFFPLQAIRILLPFSIILSALSVLLVAFLQNDLASIFSFCTFLVFVLMVWAIVVRMIHMQYKKSDSQSV